MHMLGIDIAKAELVCCLLDGKGATLDEFTLPNTVVGIRKLPRRVPADTILCFEATGPYGKLLIACLGERLPLHQLNDIQVRAGSSSMSRTKTDQRDARVIAQAGRRLALLEPDALAASRVQWSERHENMLLLVQDYERLSGEITRRNGQLEALSVNPAPMARVMEKRIRREVAALEKSKQRAAAEIEEAAEECPEAKLIRTIPGIGSLSAVALAAKIGDINRFESADKLKGYLGQYPRRFQSGKHESGGRMARHGCRLIRHLLWNIARVAARYNPVCKALFERLREKEKRVPAAYGAVARQIVQLVYGVLRSGRPFEARIAT